MPVPARKSIREALEALYRACNRRKFVHPDPLEFLYRYDDEKDVEVAGLVAALLAYGNVRQILGSAESVLGVMPSPAGYVASSTEARMMRDFRGFRHRFTTDSDLVDLLAGAREVMERHGSLGRCFAGGVGKEDETVLPALEAFAAELSRGRGYSSLVSCPRKGSACKRLCLYLRWMVREDDVDVGIWRDVPPALLLVPLDTHMHRTASALGFTERRQADMRTVLEVTEAFRALEPADPVKYDFALTRLGIRRDTEWPLLSNFTDILEAAANA